MKNFYELWVGLRSFLQWLVGGVFVFSIASCYFLLSFFIKIEKLEWMIACMCWGMVKIAGLKVQVKGLEKLEANKAYVVVFNHVNILDHFVLYNAIPGTMRGVEKASHFKWPIYGPFLRRGKQIPIQAGQGARSARESLKMAETIFKFGIHVAIAPEGTRSPSGKLMPFKKGAFHLAVDLQADLVPVIFQGMQQVNLKKSYKIYPGQVIVNIGKPIACKGKTKQDVTQLRDECYALYVECLGKDKVL
ncbi:MAG TPA: lysophospholipid acyltransferase family protein [Oligoflexia bacterium]|nr:lysophospholipid acyltransferase family protein [Oligoflexia bacterium]HMR25631.1 lysophospholipid acyltransferase family protein [Oligoflexia bacterium]